MPVISQRGRQDAMITIDAPGLSKLHRELKLAGNDVRKQLRKRIGAATIPLKAKIKENAAQVETKQGTGLAKVQSAVRTSQSYGSRGAVVRVRVDRKRAPYAADGTYFRHPIFARHGMKIGQMPPNRIANQPTEHEFFDRAIDGAQLYMEAEILKVLTDIIGMLAKG
jgi:hypothetical protein